MNRTKQEKIRLGLLFLSVILFFVVIVARLAEIQLGRNDAYRQLVDKQTSSRITIPAERGVIYDRTGRLVAKNIFRQSLYAYPIDAKELDSAGRYLERWYGLKPGTAIDKYRLTPKKFRWIERQIDDASVARIRADAPPGLYLRPESRREYPFGGVGKQIIGYTDIDNKGQSAFELVQDSLMTGKNGWASVNHDGLRNTYTVNEEALVKPTPGTSLVLTIDWRLQEIVEEELSKAVGQYNASSGMAAFMDSRTGDILAMAHFDPLDSNTDKPTKLRAIADQFEPGSVFKAFTVAACLQAGVVNFDELVDCGNGQWKMGRHTLHDDKKHGLLTFREIVELSSNVGVAKWAWRVPTDDLFAMYQNFGFGKKAGCGLPGEAGGALSKPDRWSEYTIAAMAMGHSVAVTPLQMAAAFSAIANGGEMLKPRLVLGTVDNGGFVRETGGRKVLRRAFRSEIADSLRALLRGVVENGTAKDSVTSKLVAIAGKTGTAEIPDPEHRTYFKNKFMASFGGFFPYESPVVAGIVVLRECHPITYGGLTSGPTFRRIAERYAVLNPDIFASPDRELYAQDNGSARTVKVPDLVGSSMTKAAIHAVRRGMELRASAAEGTVAWQFPPPDRQSITGQPEVVLAVVNSSSGSAVMPDLSGLSLRQASALLFRAGIKCTVRGTGVVVSQSIAPGLSIQRGLECRLECGDRRKEG
ncbi:MAG: PASTA domain-containing protein [candidate division Zixibacteria bacterium]|nr:PASTA domain-containing protein [candidate division Zixibacteria bacterium]